MKKFTLLLGITFLFSGLLLPTSPNEMAAYEGGPGPKLSISEIAAIEAGPEPKLSIGELAAYEGGPPPILSTDNA